MFRFKYSLAAGLSAFEPRVIVFVFVFALSAQATTVGIDQLALWAGGTIGLGSGVSINAPFAAGGNISTGGSVNLMSVYTESNVWLGNNSAIAGDIFAAGSIQTGSNVVIGGSANSFTDFTLPQLDLLQQSTFGTENIYARKNTTTTLTAGEYADWSFDKNTTLNLTAGEYSLKNFWMGKDGVVNIDTSAGDVILNLVGQLSTSSDVAFITSGSGSLYVNVFGSSAWLGSGTSLSAALTVYGGDFGAGASAQLAGSFFATGNIWLDSNSQLGFVPYQEIPEPASLAIFAVGSLCFLFRRKRTICA
jgi:hypothetical protein